MFAVATLLAVAASGCGQDSKPPIGDNKPCVPELVNDVKATADEKRHAFIVNKTRLTGGNTRITVTVPTTAKGKHGVAINGGIYKNVAGAGVKPGLASSLTIELKPGNYTLYDPVAHNRENGFKTKLVVSKMSESTKAAGPCLPLAHLPR